MLALAHSTVNDVWITRMRFIFIDKVGGARGTLFSSEYCPGGQYSRGDIIHSDNGANCIVDDLYRTTAMVIGELPWETPYSDQGHYM